MSVPPHGSRVPPWRGKTLMAQRRPHAARASPRGRGNRATTTLLCVDFYIAPPVREPKRFAQAAPQRPGCAKRLYEQRCSLGGLTPHPCHPGPCYDKSGNRVACPRTRYIDTRYTARVGPGGVRDVVSGSRGWSHGSLWPSGLLVASQRAYRYCGIAIRQCPALVVREHAALCPSVCLHAAARHRPAGVESPHHTPQAGASPLASCVC
jgi:hypothetical protein